MALDQYRLRASGYDSELAVFEPIRRLAIGKLNLLPGATVMDVGCGTGLSFEPLQHAVGQGGQIIGIEQCPEMLDRASERVTKRGWSNVTLVNTPAESVSITSQAEAAVFHFTHDILRNPAAIGKVVQGLKPGAQIVATGLQWSNPWAWTSNWFVLMAAMYSTTSLEGLEQPWSYLAKHLDQLEISTELMGSVYIANGVVAKGDAD
jgi:ubiquinone/menaquinone biosynthesis C-methylase UbiE